MVQRRMRIPRHAARVILLLLALALLHARFKYGYGLTC
jgi:hypothetical protein